jgi:hypothetical protein
MGALSEQEIFGCLRENFALAAQHCEDLAKLPRKGPTYRLLREELKLIEGACRQASAWREDTRYLQIGMRMAEAHKRAGDWLRGVKIDKGPRRKIPPGQMHPMFMALSAGLRALAINVEGLRLNRTNRLGMILPKPAYVPRNTSHSRVMLPIGMSRTPGGLLVPSGVAAQ